MYAHTNNKHMLYANESTAESAAVEPNVTLVNSDKLDANKTMAGERTDDQKTENDASKVWSHTMEG